MSPLLSLLAAVLVASVPVGAHARERAPNADPSPQRGFEIEAATHEISANNTACVRMRLTGNAFQPWTCENVPASISATWLVAPGTGEKRLAITVRAKDEPTVLEHLIGLGADGKTPTSYVSYLYRIDAKRCQAADPGSLTYLELKLRGCAFEPQELLGGVLYHDKRGLIVDGRVKADFSFVGTASSFWGQNGSSANIDLGSIRTFSPSHRVKPGDLKEASSQDAPDRDKPFRRYAPPASLDL